MSTATVDWSDPDSVTDYLVDYARMLAGGQRPFDEPATRDVVRRDVGRARDIAAAGNHDILPEDARAHAPLSAIAVPTTVIHGTADPMFPIAHGQALADEIEGAHLLRLDGAGHGVDRTDWDTIVQAVLTRTKTERAPTADDH